MIKPSRLESGSKTLALPIILLLSMSGNAAHCRLRVDEQNTGKTRTIQFPAAVDFGKLQFKSDEKTGREKLMPAIGMVKVPLSTKVMLEPSIYLLKNPLEIKKTIGTIDGITISGEDGKSILPVLSGNEAMEFVRVRNVTIDARTITFLNSLPNLKTLLIDDVRRGAAAAQIKNLKQLQAIRIGGETADVVLPLLARSSKLQKLEIDGTMLSDKVFELMQTLSALKFLSIQNSQFLDNSLARLPKFKSLKILWLGQHNWTSKNIAPLKTMKNLQELHMQVTTQEWQLMRQVHDALPGTLVD